MPLHNIGQFILPPITWIAPSVLGLSWANGVDGVWKALYFPQTCRTRLHDYWFKYFKGKKTYSYGDPSGSIGIALGKEKTNLFFHLSYNTSVVAEAHQKEIDLVLINLKKLNRIEKKYKISLTEVEFVSVIDKDNTSIGFGVVFIGDRDWQSSLWKISIYSFLTKSVCCSGFWLNKDKEDIRNYQKLLRSNKEMLLSKIKGEYADILPDNSFEGVHVKSGFVSICTGVNPAMKQLLLTE